MLDNDFKIYGWIGKLSSGVSRDRHALCKTIQELVSRVPYHMQAEIKSQIDNMVDAAVIVPSKS